jgi:rRNA maturation endonuclease Nob1
MNYGMKPTTYRGRCQDCKKRFTVTTMTGPTLICAACFKIRVAALWAMGDK